MALFEKLEGKLTNKDEGDNCKLKTEELDFIGLYFSAHWCPPCRGFTPQLVDYYKKQKEGGQRFEIIFVSFDRDEASFKDYFDSMPWLALISGEQDEKESLSTQFGVSGIPDLVILDRNGNILERDGRKLVGSGKDLSTVSAKK